MSELVRIRAAGLPEMEVQLRPGSARVGRGAACDVRIDHPELDDYVAALDHRGSVCLIQNLCPYEIFVGPRSIPPRGWGEWHVGDELRLSRSVSLDLLSAQTTDAAPKEPSAPVEKKEPSPSESRKQTIQLAVTIACLVLMALLALVDSGSGPSEPEDTFPELMSSLKDKRGPNDKIIRDYLQTAWMLDQRQKSKDDREAAIRYYRLLINELRSYPMDRASEYSRVKVFATQRIAYLGR
jgi:hypothetical protein